jgi:hypothetical protein
MVSYVPEAREYEDDSDSSENSPAQPFGRRLLFWPAPTHEGRVKCPSRESPYNGRDSDDYLKNPACQDFLPLCSPRLTKVYLGNVAWAQVLICLNE